MTRPEIAGLGYLLHLIHRNNGVMSDQLVALIIQIEAKRLPQRPREDAHFLKGVMHIHMSRARIEVVVVRSVYLVIDIALN